MFVAVGILGAVVGTMYGIYWIFSNSCEDIAEEWSSETPRRYSWPALVQNYYGEETQPGEKVAPPENVAPEYLGEGFA